MKKNKAKAITPSQERRSYIAPIILDVKKLARPVLGKFGFTQIDIISHWNEIVGEKIATYTKPFKLTSSKSMIADTNLILHVTTKGGAFATELMHQKTIVLERINTYFGFNAVKDIKITQGCYEEKTTKEKSMPESAKDETKISPAVETIISTIEDEELQAKLSFLARAISKKNS